MKKKERIELLFKTGEISSVALAAVLLQTFPLEEQIKIFEGICNKKGLTDYKEYLAKGYLDIRPYDSIFDCFNVIGKDWTIYYNGALHMLKKPHNPGKYKEINI